MLQNGSARVSALKHPPDYKLYCMSCFVPLFLTKCEQVGAKQQCHLNYRRNTAAYASQPGFKFQIWLKWEQMLPSLTVRLSVWLLLPHSFLIRSICPAPFLLIILKLAPLFFSFCSVFSTRAAANMWFHLSSSEIRVEENRLMVICLSLSLLSPLTVARLDERTCIFCFSFKFRCPKKKSTCGLLATPTQKCWIEKKEKISRVDKERNKKSSSSCKHKSSEPPVLLHDVFWSLDQLFLSPIDSKVCLREPVEIKCLQ